MVLMRRACFFTIGLLVCPSIALAQGEPPPQLPPPQQYPPPQQGQYYPPAQQQPQYYPPPQQPQYYPPPQQQRPPPPPVEYTPPPEPTHAPKYSLWAGPRIGYMGFGFSFFQNANQQNETTGNFVGNGVPLELDIGARLAHKYIPFLFWEHGFMGTGHRFEGSNVTTTTDFYGLGFRFGGADDIGFVSELMIGKREIRVSDGSNTYKMSGLEIFRLGLGAEFRLDTLFTIEAMVSVSGGSLSDKEGDVNYSASGSGDGLKSPNPAKADGSHDTIINNSSTYVVLGIGVGVHFDIFGK
jgi:hypothetical protein